MEAGLVVPPRALLFPSWFSREILYSDISIADLPEASPLLSPLPVIDVYRTFPFIFLFLEIIFIIEIEIFFQKYG